MTEYPRMLERLSHYEILEKLGEGGMGVIYKARDARLGRLVAIKILPPEKTADPDRKRRFIQEAKTASALNHPNIVTIYDIGTEDGVDFIVMEYIAGRTLDQVIPKQGMPLRDVLNCAIPVADGLAKAHAAGIVHRDLKPGNILVADDGTPKLLDFGLAKLVETVPRDLAETQPVEPSGTAVTEDGAVLGTVAYMSPEQAEAKSIDARSDVFSFGCVLYEMLTGQRAFGRGTRISTLAAILKDEPKPITEFVPGLPREVERLVERCLRKETARRWQTVADVRTSLQEFKEDSDTGVLTGATSAAVSARSHLGVVVAAVTVFIVGGALATWFLLIRKPPLVDTIVRPIPLTSDPGSEDNPSFSPDGTQVTYSWNGQGQDNFDIYVKGIGPDPPLRLTQDPDEDNSPAWSPDGNRIAFLRIKRPGRAKVLLIPRLGGPEREIAEIAMEGRVRKSLTWTPDNKSLVVWDRPEGQPGGLWLLSLERRELRRLTSAPAGFVDTTPAFSPDALTLAFARRGGPPASDVYLLRLTPDLRPTGEPIRLTHDEQYIRSMDWTTDGRELIFSSGPVGNASLWRMPVAGEARPRQMSELTGITTLSYSRRANRLVFGHTTKESDIYRAELSTDGDPRGSMPLIASSRDDFAGRYSPDGKKIAFVSLRSGGTQLWVCDADGSNPMQLTSLARGDIGPPFWAADSHQIVFESNTEGGFQPYIVDASGGSPRPIDISLARQMMGVSFLPANQLGSARATVNKTFYFLRRGSVWSQPIEGGEEHELFKFEGAIGGMAASKFGLYFVANSTPTTPGEMMFYRFPDGPVTKISGVESPAGQPPSVSPEGRYLLYTKMNSSGVDLMILENLQ